MLRTIVRKWTPIMAAARGKKNPFLWSHHSRHISFPSSPHPSPFRRNIYLSTSHIMYFSTNTDVTRQHNSPTIPTTSTSSSAKLPSVTSVDATATATTTATTTTTTTTASKSRKILTKDLGNVSPTTYDKITSTLRSLRDFIRLYWQSVKSFVQEVKLGVRLVYRIYLKGHRYTRSERRKMQQAALDVVKVLPFVSMTLVVGTEVTALLAARAIPSMLPAAFQPVAKKVDESLPKFVDKVLPSGKAQEMARNKTRVEIADKLHELSLEYVTHLKEVEQQPDDDGNVVGEDADMISAFLAKTDDHEARVTQSDIAGVGPAFRRHMQLQQLGSAPRGREVLVRLSQYLNVNSGSEMLNMLLPTFFLVRRLRMRVQNARADDKDIHFEGVVSLSNEELLDACYERGLAGKVEETLDVLTMRSRLRDWISLSINRGVPSSLLILSSALISRSQLKLEQEQGANALQIATLQHRIQELNAKIGKRTQQRDEAARLLKNLTGGTGDLVSRKVLAVSSKGNVVKKDDSETEVEQVRTIYEMGGTVHEALSSVGIKLDDNMLKMLTKTSNTTKNTDVSMEWKEFLRQFTELKHRARRAEALVKIEHLLLEN